MIIDFKMKPPLPKWEKLFQDGKTGVTQLFETFDIEPTLSNTLEEVRSEMDQQGVVKAVIWGRDNVEASSNQELADFLQSANGESFYGMIGIDNMTLEEAVETIHRYAKTGLFHGVSLNPATVKPRLSIGDPRLDTIFEACLHYKLPFCITLSVIIAMVNDQPEYDFIRPNQLIRIAKKYPELPIVISHAAWPFFEEAIATAFYCRNVYLCPDFYMAFPGRQLFLEAANIGLEDQIIYASCYPNVPYDFALKSYNELDWKDGVLEKVLYKNAAKLLKIE